LAWLFFYAISLSLSLPVIAKFLKRAACILSLQALCKDHLDCSCFLVRQQELGTRLPEFSPNVGKTDLITTLLFTGTK
jgi:hypothetical protein